MPKVAALCLSLLLILTLSRIITIETTFASTPKPSVPQFTINFINRSYDVPTTQSVDPYTGKLITIPSHQKENKTIEVTINNQAFASQLFYNIRVKGHFSESWTEVYKPADGFPIQSNSEDTVLFFSSKGGDDFYGSYSAIIHAPPGQVDFQIEAMTGSISRNISIPVPGTGWVFTGETSGWSNTQTITIPESKLTTTPSTSSSQSLTPAPSQSSAESSVLFGLNSEVVIAVLLVVVVVLLVFVVIYLRKRNSVGSVKKPSV